VEQRPDAAHGVQMIRSGQFGRKSLSYALQHAFQRWLNGASVGRLLSASIGADPSCATCLRLARPTPTDNARRALFGWLTGKDVEKWGPAVAGDLPEEVRALTAYRAAETEAEQVEILGPHRASAGTCWPTPPAARPSGRRSPGRWAAQALRMNLNTLLRHERVTDDADMAAYVAGRIADPDEVRRARQFPYQYFAAHLNAEKEFRGRSATRWAVRPRSALVAATCRSFFSRSRRSCSTAFWDVSGSMGFRRHGARRPGRGATSKVRCVTWRPCFAAGPAAAQPGQRGHPVRHRGLPDEVGPDEPILDRAPAPVARYTAAAQTDCSLPAERTPRPAGPRFRRAASCQRP